MHKRYIAVWAVTLSAVLVITAIWYGPSRGERAAVSPREPVLMPTVTVDAGHGGFDGGAVAKDGTAEKDINLAVALPLADLLRVCGMRPVMTRETDTALCTDKATVREKKVADMKARLRLFEEASMNVSVHQNIFSDSRYRGAQVFYSANHEGSAQLAESIRSHIVQALQPDNTRELKSGNRDVYLLHKATKPTVLVECGFLSNPEELAQLRDEGYVRRLALCICLGAAAYAAS